MAVIAGVFLASYGITVLAGVGLSQLFFEESLVRTVLMQIEFARTPVENASGWSNNTTTMTKFDELLKFSEFNDCTWFLDAKESIVVDSLT